VLEHLVVLSGMFTALKDGDTTAEDLLGKKDLNVPAVDKAKGAAKSNLDAFTTKKEEEPKAEEPKKASVFKKPEAKPEPEFDDEKGGQ